MFELYVLNWIYISISFLLYKHWYLNWHLDWFFWIWVGIWLEIGNWICIGIILLYFFDYIIFLLFRLIIDECNSFTLFYFSKLCFLKSNLCGSISLFWAGAFSCCGLHGAQDWSQSCCHSGMFLECLTLNMLFVLLKLKYLFDIALFCGSKIL